MGEPRAKRVCISVSANEGDIKASKIFELKQHELYNILTIPSPLPWYTPPKLAKEIGLIQGVPLEQKSFFRFCCAEEDTESDTDTEGFSSEYESDLISLDSSDFAVLPRASDSEEEASLPVAEPELEPEIEWWIDNGSL